MSFTSDLETSFKLTDTFYSQTLAVWVRKSLHCIPKRKEFNTFKSWIKKMDAHLSFNDLLCRKLVQGQHAYYSDILDNVWAWL